MNTTPILCLIGPTASGKTTAALKLAEIAPIEIINVDSTLIYQGMDIGTAKPTKQERSKIPHHLIDIIQPTEQYSAARFANEAKTACLEITRRKHIPLLVGGTMLYYTAFVNPLNNLPDGNPTLRAHIIQEANKFGWQELHTQLKFIDPTSAEKISPKDSQRIQRALEVFKITGIPLSTLIKETNKTKKIVEKKNIITIALIPSNRSVMHQRIATRLDQMLSQGFLEEVTELRKKFVLTADMSSMRAVGYRQAWLYLDNKLSKNAFQDQTLAATRQLYKKQSTWLRRITVNYIVDPLSETWLEQLVNVLKKHINFHECTCLPK